MNTILRETVLITGGAGFIGSNFIPFFLGNNPNYEVVNLDKLTYAGDLKNLAEVEQNKRYRFIKGDICDREHVDAIFKAHQITSVIHFAAESHVDNSISSPKDFIKTNIEGTFTLLESAREHWMGSYDKTRFHHISTDEVYGSLGTKGFFAENTPYAPNSPYSASKASSDFLVRSYFHTYGLNVVTSNCSNNYGPKQHDEKLIPTIIRKALNGEEIPIYGDGKNIRDWLYVLDHCRGVEKVFKSGESGGAFVIGGDGECSNLEIATRICDVLDKKCHKKGTSYHNQISFVKDRPGHDFRYAINASKIKKELHWEQMESLASGLEKTINWYINKYEKE